MFIPVIDGASNCGGVSVVLRHVGLVWCVGGLETAVLNLSSCGNGSKALMRLMGRENRSTNIKLP